MKFSPWRDFEMQLMWIMISTGVSSELKSKAAVGFPSRPWGHGLGHVRFRLVLCCQ